MGRRVAGCILAVIAIGLAACGDGDGDDSASPSTEPVTSDTAATTTPPTARPTTEPTTTAPPETAAPTTELVPETTLAPPVSTAAPAPGDPLLIPPGTIEDGTHYGYLVSQSPGWFAFDRADVAADGSWSNTNPKVRNLPIGAELALVDGTPIVVVVQAQRVVDATMWAPAPNAEPGPASSDPGVTSYVVPSPDPGASWGDTHSSYPATDIFVPGGCGGDVVSPVSGTLLEVRRVNGYDSAVDNPATRGGLSVSILGDDGVRYYLAHFASIRQEIAVGGAVDAGQLLGAIGETGRTSACHIHFGISPPCPDQEWSVRRGVIWPFGYLDAWRDGVQVSPVDEVAAWAAANPNACADAALDPNAPDA